MVAALALLNIKGTEESARLNLVLAIADLLTQIVLVIIGLALVFNADLLVTQIDLGSVPSWSDFALGIAVGMVAYTGIETISNMAEEARDPSRTIPRGTLYVVLAVVGLYALLPAIALSAMPVVEGANGEFTTELATTFADDPVLGIVENIGLSAALTEALEVYVGILAAVILLIATNAGLIGLSRLTFSMGQHRQLPSFLRQIHPRFKTPYVAIIVFSGVAMLVMAPGQTTFLGTIYAFGATLSFTVAHISVVRLRKTRPLAGRPRSADGTPMWKMPGNFSVRGTQVPLMAVIGGLGTFGAFLVAMVLDPIVLITGGGWMIAGTLLYIGYRRYSGLPLTETVKVESLTPLGVEEVEYKSVLVAFDEDDPFDAETVVTARSLAARRRRAIHVLALVTVPVQPAARRAPRGAGRQRPDEDRAGEADLRPARQRPRRTCAHGPGRTDDRRRGQGDQRRRDRDAAALSQRRTAIRQGAADRAGEAALPRDRLRASGRARRRLQRRGAAAAMSRPAPDEVYRGVTRLFAVVIIGFGITIVAVTLAQGGGVTAFGFWIGLIFTGLGAGRLYLSLRGAGGEPVIDPLGSERERSPLANRWLGVPALFAVAFSAVGFSLYFSLGLVADRGLGLTPVIFLGVGLIFLLNTLTYVEGEAMLPERGGSATFARHAFKNELISFIAGWAILIDYMIVIALAAISVPHYLTPIWSGFNDAGGELVVAGLVIALTAALTIAAITGTRRRRSVIVVAVAGVMLLLAVIVVGLVTSFDLDVLTSDLDPFDPVGNPSLDDLIYAGVIATVAFAGIEAAAQLAPDVRGGPRDLRKLVIVAAALVPLIYFGVAAVSLMALPLVPGPGGPESALGTTFIENPVLGVVQSFEPAWVSDLMELAVVLVVPVALIWAANTAMLGLSRHVYVLATNRQIPSWLGKLNRRWQTPHVAILLASLLAFVLVAPTDVELLGGLFAFGATIAFTIAHASIIKLRISRARPATAFSRSLRHRLPRRESAAADGGRGCADRACVAQRRHLQRCGDRGRRRLDGVRAGRLRDLSQGRRGNDADPADRGSGRGAGQGRALGRVRRHPRAGVRLEARRRHRRHRRSAGGGGGREGRAVAAARGRLRHRPADDGAARLAAAAGSGRECERGARAGAAGGGGVRDGRGADLGRAGEERRRRDRRGGAPARCRDDRHGRRAADEDPGRSAVRRRRRIAPRRGRAGDRVRVATRTLPGAGHGASQ